MHMGLPLTGVTHTALTLQVSDPHLPALGVHWYPLPAVVNAHDRHNRLVGWSIATQIRGSLGSARPAPTTHGNAIG